MDNANCIIHAYAELDRNVSPRYTPYMRLYRYSMLLVLVLGILLTSCSPGHTGSNEIAFIRNGHLWTIDPNGANAFQIVAQDTPAIGYSWSPNHQLLVFRTLDAQFAKTTPAKQLPTNIVTGQIADAPSTINTIGIDGGTPIPIMLSNSGVQYSNPYWNPGGTRLIYRQESTTAAFSTGSALWWVSQNDQPEGIAAKHLPPSYSLPSVSSTDNMAIENFSNGLFSSTLQGTNVHYLVNGPLLGHPLPATLERVLWQPAHANPLLLYATTSSRSQSLTKDARLTVQLVTRSQNGQMTVLTSCTCTQFAWSPNGLYVLYSDGTTFTILNVSTGSSFSVTADVQSVPYWSPNDAYLLLDGPHHLQLVNVATQAQRTLLTDGTPSPPSQSSQPSSIQAENINSLVQPVPNSIWAADSTQFLFLTRGRLQSQSKTLTTGLYTASIDTHGQIQGIPTRVDAGNDTQAGWTYQDINTSFLY